MQHTVKPMIMTEIYVRLKKKLFTSFVRGLTERVSLLHISIPRLIHYTAGVQGSLKPLRGIVLRNLCCAGVVSESRQSRKLEIASKH